MASILVVEDDPALTRAIARNLQARQYDTRTATNVRDAIDMVRRQRPSIILLDIDLPDGSGWEVLRAVRAGNGQDVAVIVMSALRPNPRLVGELGCVGVLEKPFPMEVLLRQIATCLERIPGHAPFEAKG